MHPCASTVGSRGLRHLGLALLRPQAELCGETVLIANPSATYRLRREDVVAVTDGLYRAAVFHRRDGFKTRVVASGEASANIRDGRPSGIRAVLGL